jgi:hypothetical protein
MSYAFKDQNNGFSSQTRLTDGKAHPLARGYAEATDLNSNEVNRPRVATPPAQ